MAGESGGEMEFGCFCSIALGVSYLCFFSRGGVDISIWVELAAWYVG
jgi:hypothetical protein